MLVFSIGMSSQPVIYLIKSIFVKRKACSRTQVSYLSHQCNVQMAKLIIKLMTLYGPHDTQAVLGVDLWWDLGSP